jgi:photosystem I subunit 11
VAYLENIPRAIIEKEVLDKLLNATPRDQWENPPEDSFLYILKAYAETYGPGKATKMGWYDYFTMKLDLPGSDDIPDQQYMDNINKYFTTLSKGQVPFAVPGPGGWWYSGAVIQWRGKEPFAGDQVQTPVTSGRFAVQFLAALAFYREGLKPWQRGLEIGMAHGYFLIGPFVSLGPLRNTPEAATVGLLCGCAIVGLVSIGGLIFGTTIKPTLFDKEGDKEAAGFIEMINWHAIGGLGGAGFAHALLTVFGG